MLRNCPHGFEDLLDDSTPATLILTTLRRDGTPMLVPLWFVSEPEALLFVTDPASLKLRHIKHDARVAAMILSTETHNRYVHLSGVARVRDDRDALVVFDRVMWKYEKRGAESATSMAIVEITPTAIRGFDFREPASTEGA